MGRRPLVQTSVADTLTISSLSASVLLSLTLMVVNRWPCLLCTGEAVLFRVLLSI